MSKRLLSKLVTGRNRTVTGSFRRGVRLALLAGTWLALTLLFIVGGLHLVVTGTAAMGQSPALILALFVGVLGVYSLAPTLAKAVLVIALEQADALFDRTATVWARWQPNASKATDSNHCSECCCV